MICSEMNGKINLSDAAAIDMNKQLDIQTKKVNTWCPAHAKNHPNSKD